MTCNIPQLSDHQTGKQTIEAKLLLGSANSVDEFLRVGHHLEHVITVSDERQAADVHHDRNSIGALPIQDRTNSLMLIHHVDHPS